MPEALLFLDTSALFSAIWSSSGGARLLLKLGESGAVRLLASPRVLSELEDVIRRKAPQHMGVLALILDRSRITVAPSAQADLIQRCRALVPHAGDARILADAWHNQAHFFVTLDRAHFLDVPGLAGSLPFPIGTPGDCLAWLRYRWGIEK